MSRYRVTGKPNIPFDVLTDHSVGDEFDAELDKDEERMLVDIGALEKLPPKRSSSPKSSTKSSDKEKEDE